MSGYYGNLAIQLFLISPVRSRNHCSLCLSNFTQIEWNLKFTHILQRDFDVLRKWRKISESIKLSIEISTNCAGDRCNICEYLHCMHGKPTNFIKMLLDLLFVQSSKIVFGRFLWYAYNETTQNRNRKNRHTVESILTTHFFWYWDIGESQIIYRSVTNLCWSS